MAYKQSKDDKVIYEKENNCRCTMEAITMEASHGGCNDGDFDDGGFKDGG